MYLVAAFEYSVSQEEESKTATIVLSNINNHLPVPEVLNHSIFEASCWFSTKVLVMIQFGVTNGCSGGAGGGG